MKTFTFVCEPASVHAADIVVDAACEKAAYQAAWSTLTSEQQDAVACLECVAECEAEEVAA